MGKEERRGCQDSFIFWYLRRFGFVFTQDKIEKILKKYVFILFKDFAPAKDAGSRTRTGTRLPPSDFESDASAIPPRRHIYATKLL